MDLNVGVLDLTSVWKMGSNASQSSLHSTLTFFGKWYLLQKRRSIFLHNWKTKNPSHDQDGTNHFKQKKGNFKNVPNDGFLPSTGFHIPNVIRWNLEGGRSELWHLM